MVHVQLSEQGHNIVIRVSCGDVGDSHGSNTPERAHFLCFLSLVARTEKLMIMMLTLLSHTLARQPSAMHVNCSTINFVLT